MGGKDEDRIVLRGDIVVLSHEHLAMYMGPTVWGMLRLVLASPAQRQGRVKVVTLCRFAHVLHARVYLSVYTE